jgi:SAM-dependent methyltransferase
VAKKKLTLARDTHSQRSLAKSIAESVDATPALLAVLPELVEDLQSLGSIPELVCDLLKKAGCRKSWRILDFACGKGAVAVAAAERFRCKVTGVDGFAPFIRSAKAFARERKVNALTTWKVQDVRQFPARAQFDASMMIGLFGFADAAPLLRRHTKPGGIYIIDDAVLLRRDKRLGWPARADAHEYFSELGDDLLEEVVPPVEQIRALNSEIETSLMFRATVLAQQHPDLREDLEDFIARQLDAGRLLESRLRPILWLVRRGQE